MALLRDDITHDSLAHGDFDHDAPARADDDIYQKGQSTKTLPTTALPHLTLPTASSDASPHGDPAENSFPVALLNDDIAIINTAYDDSSDDSLRRLPQLCHKASSHKDFAHAGLALLCPRTCHDEILKTLDTRHWRTRL